MSRFSVSLAGFALSAASLFSFAAPFAAADIVATTSKPAGEYEEVFRLDINHLWGIGGFLSVSNDSFLGDDTSPENHVSYAYDSAYRDFAGGSGGYNILLDLVPNSAFDYIQLGWNPDWPKGQWGEYGKYVLVRTDAGFNVLGGIFTVNGEPVTEAAGSALHSGYTPVVKSLETFEYEWVHFISGTSYLTGFDELLDELNLSFDVFSSGDLNLSVSFWKKVPNEGSGGGASTPEPATLAVFGCGLAGLAALRRRKK